MPRATDNTPAFSTRPHPLFIFFFPIRQYASILLFTLCAWLAVMVFAWAGFGELGVEGSSILLAGLGALAVRVVWAALQWVVRRYGVEEPDEGPPTVFGAVGVLNRTRSEVPVDGLRNIVVDKPFFQRILGIGSVGFASAGTGGYEVVWRIVGDPDALASRVRLAQHVGDEDRADTPADGGQHG